MLVDVLLVALGGGLGGVGRVWVSDVVARHCGGAFPWGTLVVNVSGAACIGVLAGLLLGRDSLSLAQAPVRAGLVVGLLGSYTTVSSFSLQTLALARSGEILRAAWNVLGTLALCLSAVATGYTAAVAIAAGT
jgi:fluoride exporter